MPKCVAAVIAAKGQYAKYWISIELCSLWTNFHEVMEIFRYCEFLTRYSHFGNVIANFVKKLERIIIEFVVFA
jgi:hypothetical protein